MLRLSTSCSDSVISVLGSFWFPNFLFVVILRFHIWTALPRRHLFATQGFKMKMNLNFPVDLKKKKNSRLWVFAVLMCGALIRLSLATQF